MHIALLTYGSRGDMQPFLALAVGLQKAGHTICLAGPECFKELVEQHAVPFFSLAGNPEEISMRFNNAGTNPVKVIRSIRDYVYAIAPQVAGGAHKSMEGADLVIHSFLFTTGAHSFARDMDIPDISVQTFPMFAPTRAFPNVSMAKIPPGIISYFSHWLATQIFWYGGNTGMPSFRRQYPQDFPVRLYWPFRQNDKRPVTPLVFAYSPSVLPRPVEWNTTNISIPGYFFLDEVGFKPPSALLKYLEAGQPPVCVSFGSMIHQHGESIRDAILDALRQTHQRAIILTGWGGWTSQTPTEDIFTLKSAPHDWLFPRCKLLIHHGGAGTTGAGLRAGKPNIVIPFAGDQPFWAERVAEIGAGPKPIPVKKLNAELLVKAIKHTLNDSNISQSAYVIGKKIGAEDGVSETVRLVENWANRYPSKKR